MKEDYRITHWCGVPQKFLSEERLKEAIDAGFNLLSGEYKDVIILNMAGLSSTYANDGGIIVTI